MEVEKRRGAENVVVGGGSKFPLTFWEMTIASGVLVGFLLGLFGVYMTMPASDYSFLKLPQNLEDLQILRVWTSRNTNLPTSVWPAPTLHWGNFRKKSFGGLAEPVKIQSLDIVFPEADHLDNYTSDYTAQVLVSYCMVYIFMQTFMIPGTVFLSLLAGSLFGVFKGVPLVVFNATAGASSCYFLSKLIGRPLVFSLWPDKLGFFQDQVAKRRERLLNYMLFLRVTPTLPNTFINVASPIVDIPYHIFFFATFIGLIPAAYVTVRAGLALGELRSVGDLYDFQSIATLFLIGVVSVAPSLMSKSKS